ncbi:MAG: hypothetical protein A3E85_05750 [Gammaproteobacteria bacterium RIFCSPHIGHO2_12_FULL_45_12]|nr:MAG: hypothetical protein A3E85_05750 [Gammaproteobacteria bacterium RIFCSPHIGHO2_12_FULL_45_12]
MKNIAYGAYNDLIIGLANTLTDETPETKEKIETIIFKQAMYIWAQDFFTARSEKEIRKGELASNNDRTLTEAELKEVGQFTPGIVEVIKRCLYPEMSDIPSNIKLILESFEKSCSRRLQDYNRYWHPFYALQQMEIKKQYSLLSSSTFFDFRANPQAAADIMAKVWRQIVMPEVSKKIGELKREGIQTMDGKIPMSDCLNNHMLFIDHMVENAGQYMGAAQRQLSSPQQCVKK